MHQDGFMPTTKARRNQLKSCFLKLLDFNMPILNWPNNGSSLHEALSGVIPLKWIVSKISAPKSVISKFLRVMIQTASKQYAAFPCLQ